MKAYPIALFLFAISISSVHAGNAQQCVSVGSTGSGQTLTNNCNQQIEVVWCHDNGMAKHSDSKCGQGGKFYQKHDVLAPGEVKSNSYTLPASGTIYYGACTGGYYSTKQSGGGSYSCK